MEETEKQLAMIAIRHTVAIGLYIALSSVFLSAQQPPAADSLTGIEKRWSEITEASRKNRRTKAQYSELLPSMHRLIGTPSKSLLSQLTKKTKEDPDVNDDFCETLRQWLLDYALKSTDKSMLLRVLSESPPASMPFIPVERYIVEKKCPAILVVLFDATDKASAQWAKKRLVIMIERAFPGLREKHKDNDGLFLLACRQWLTQHEKGLSLVEEYGTSGRITSGKRKEITVIPDCVLFEVKSTL